MEVTVPSDAFLSRKMTQGYKSRENLEGNKEGLGRRMSYEIII